MTDIDLIVLIPWAIAGVALILACAWLHISSGGRRAPGARAFEPGNRASPAALPHQPSHIDWALAAVPPCRCQQPAARAGHGATRRA
jgi:hypothetical protein